MGKSKTLFSLAIHACAKEIKRRHEEQDERFATWEPDTDVPRNPQRMLPELPPLGGWEAVMAAAEMRRGL